MPNSDVIEFECPECHQAIHVSVELIGIQMECPGCFETLVIPKKPVARQDDDGDQHDGQLPFEDSNDFSFENPANEAAAKEAAAIENSRIETRSDETDVDDDEDPFARLEIPGEPGPSIAGSDVSGREDLEKPIKFDGISDSISFDGVYGIQCRICDTRIHVRPEQAESYVECPVCFSKVKVTPPKKVAKSVSTRHNSRLKNTIPDVVPDDNDDDDLRLSDPIERPEIDISYGLAPVTKDLLAPKIPEPPKSPEEPVESTSVESTSVESNDGEPSDIPELEILDPQEISNPSLQKPQQDPAVHSDASRQESSSGESGRKKTSRRERFEAAQRREDQIESNRSLVNPSGKTHPSNEEKNFPDYDFGSSLTAVFEMIRSPGLIWRALVIAALMSFGVVVMLSFESTTDTESAAESATMLEAFSTWSQWLLLGVLPYFIGLFFLWFVCGYIFRDTALGQRQVKSWKNAGLAEITGTFFLFSFGFFIAGLPVSVPALFLGVALVLPLQLILAPPFLLSAWFNQSPFAIVSVDAFENAIQQKSQWTAFYIFMLVLGVAALFTTLLFGIRSVIPIFAVNAIISVFATFIVILVTLAFASVCGWHCGRVVDDLEESH